jgi:hypothetical protein
MSPETGHTQLASELLFRTFLERSCISKAYYSNFEEFPKDHFDGNFFSVTPPSNFISDAFHWQDTPEGSDYWCDFDNIWKLIVEAFDL